MIMKPTGDHWSHLDSDGSDCEMLASLLGNMPVALALRQFHRCTVIRELTSGFDGTILDIGCGDAAVWQALHPTSRVYGIDINARAIRRARGRIPAMVADLCTPDLASRLDAEWGISQFEMVTGISSFEHIPDIMGALRSAKNLLSENGMLLLIVPSPEWTRGACESWWRNCCPRITMAVAGAVDGFFQHWHLLDQNGWKALANACGLQVTETRCLFDPRIERAFWSLLPFAAVSQVARTLLGQYPSNLVSRSSHFRLANFLYNRMKMGAGRELGECVSCYDIALVLANRN